MADLILRAGPWASTESYFISQPDVIDETTQVYPVNAANSFSSTWPWQLLYYINNFGTSFEEQTLETTQNTLTLTYAHGEYGGGATIEFYYQATHEWSFSSGQVEGEFCQVYVNNLLVEESEGSIDLSAIMLPETVVPVSVFIVSTGFEEATVSNISITL